MSTSVPPSPPGDDHERGPYGPPPASSPTDQFFDGVRRANLLRSEDRWVGGVAGGLSMRAGVDPLVGRALFVLAAFMGGLGLIAYGIGWALLPEQRDGRIHLQELFRGSFDVAIIGAFLTTVVGLSSSGTFGPWWGFWGGDGWTGVVWVSVLVLVAVVVVAASRSASGGTSPGPAGTPSAPPSNPAADAARASGETMTSAAPGGPAAPATAHGSGYGGGGGHGAYGGPHRPSSPLPPTPPEPVVRGAGATATGVVVGLGLLTFAALMVAARYDAWDGPVLVTAGAVTVVLAGLGIALAGTRGRSSGGLGAVAVLTAIVIFPVAALNVSWPSGGVVTGVGELHQSPVSVVEAQRGYSIGAGDARIDLTELSLPTDGALVEIPVSLGAGDVTVTMPRDGAYTASVQVFAGEVRWLGERVRSGVGNHVVELESPAVRDGATPRVHLDITVGAGEAEVVEAQR